MIKTEADLEKTHLTSARCVDSFGRRTVERGDCATAANRRGDDEVRHSRAVEGLRSRTAAVLKTVTRQRRPRPSARQQLARRRTENGFFAAAPYAEIAVLQLLVGGELGGRAGPDHLALFQDVVPVGEGAQRLDVLVDDDDRKSRVLQVLELRPDFLADFRGEPLAPNRCRLRTHRRTTQCATCEIRSYRSHFRERQ